MSKVLSSLKTRLEKHYEKRSPTSKNVCDYSDDWDSDYSDDWEVDVNDLSELKPSKDIINLVPADPTAFEASFCRRRQEAIDNMSYREAINSWKSKRLEDIVKHILQLSTGQNLIDRAWIVFYWVSQNIEYDVEAYFNGHSRRQTVKDIFANGKGVCDAFGTIFETLCTTVQIECKKIGGYAKGYGFRIGQK